MRFQDQQSLDGMLRLMEELAGRFKERPIEEGAFPFENIEDLKAAGYTGLTVPKEFGGRGITLYEMVRLQEKLAEGDGSTALSIGWHMGIMKNIPEKKLWKDEMYRRIASEVLKGALVNSAASEAQTGSPTRGGRPQTTAEKTPEGWRVTGRKIFTTMAPVLDYFLVSAGVQGEDRVGTFLIPRTAEGLKIEETWDSVAMSGTGSHDLVLTDVALEEDAFLEEITPGKKQANGWLLHIPACYLGIAKAAQREAVQFATSYSPNSIKGTIADIPAVRQKIGEIELELMRASEFLYSAAKKWDDASSGERAQLSPELGAVKLAVTNAAIKAVDLSMRVVGARSLSAKSPLQRYYRDVRAGLHNPPMDDMTIEMLAQKAFNEAK